MAMAKKTFVFKTTVLKNYALRCVSDSSENPFFKKKRLERIARLNAKKINYFFLCVCLVFYGVILYF